MVLPLRDQTLVRLFSAVVLGRWDEVERIKGSEEAEPRWREAVLMTHLFAGFPRMVEAFERLDGALTPPAEAEIGDGAELFSRIYADLAGDVAGRLAELDPKLHTWITEHAYGRVLSRSGLGADRRELLAVAALAVTEQDRQLMSHVRGAIRCGATADEVLAVVDVVADWLDDPERVRAIARRFSEAA